jgi:hypothetical protein
MNETTPIRIGSKDILARAMAAEDITVEHRGDIETAYFDVKSRTLALPTWKDMSNSMYDMLVGHEVSHALHTPADGWMDWVGDSPLRKACLNIVEDARIERLIKEQFPGIKRDFADAYKTFSERDTFDIKGKDLSQLSLLDRLNIHFKLGLFGLVDVTFTTEEQVFVDRMATTETFEDVMDLANDLYDKSKEEQQEQSSDGEGEDKQSVQMNANGNEDMSDDGESLTDDTDDGESLTDDTDDGESAEDDSPQGDGLEYDDYSNDIGQTQDAFERSVRELRDENSAPPAYFTIPEMDLDNIIVDFSTLKGLLDTIRPNSNEEEVESALTKLRNIKRESKSTVNHMVQQFQMKQAADADKRTDIAKTGILDTTTMINYRWSEDIFLKNEVHADGENHGLVLFMDWSGSMSSILEDTYKQLLILVEFCRKVGIPYEVYSFSSARYIPGCDNIQGYYERMSILKENPLDPQFKKVRDTDVNPHDFTLYNLFSSRMTAKQHQDATENIWLCVEGLRCYRIRVPYCMDLGSTPLNEAVIAAMDIVPQFQKSTGVQIVNTIFLTDGDGHSIGMHGHWDPRTNTTATGILRDHQTKKTYRVQSSETAALLSMLRDRTGCEAIGIRLNDGASLRYFRYSLGHLSDAQFESICSDYSRNKYTVVETVGYSAFIVVRGDIKVEDDLLGNLDEDASYTKIKNAFIKGGNQKKLGRVVASRIVDYIV